MPMKGVSLRVIGLGAPGDASGRAAVADRRCGYINAMRKQGLAEHLQVVLRDYREESVALAVRGELFRRVSLSAAVFAANDRCAVGASVCTSACERDRGGDISIVGFQGQACRPTAAHRPHSSVVEDELARFGLDKSVAFTDRGTCRTHS